MTPAELCREHANEVTLALDSLSRLATARLYAEHVSCSGTLIRGEINARTQAAQRELLGLLGALVHLRWIHIRADAPDVVDAA